MMSSFSFFWGDEEEKRNLIVGKKQKPKGQEMELCFGILLLTHMMPLVENNNNNNKAERN